MMLKRLKYTQPVIGILFILVILIIGKQAHSGYYSCNDLTSNSLDLNLYRESSTVDLFTNKNLARRANRLCLKQLAQDQSNPQYNFQVAYTYLALNKYKEGKKYLDLAIEEEYPAALYYSWVGQANRWFDYKDEHLDNLKKAAKTNYFAKYMLAYFYYLQEAWYAQGEERKKKYAKATSVLKEIDFFLPAKNALLILEITNNPLDYLKIKETIEIIELNNNKILELYNRRGYDYLSDIYSDLGLELGNQGYANLGLKYLHKEVELDEIQFKNPVYGYDSEGINYQRAINYQKLGYSYLSTGNMSKAREYFVRGINLIQNNYEYFKEEEPALYPNTLNLLGLTFTELEQNDLGIKLFRKAHEYYQSLEKDGIPEGFAIKSFALSPLMNIGIFTNDKKESNLFLEKAYNFLLEDDHLLIGSMNGLGVLIQNYLYEGKINEAKEVYNKISENYEKNKEGRNVGLTHVAGRYEYYLFKFTGAQILIEDENYEKAKKDLQKINSYIEEEKYLDFSDYYYLKATYINLLRDLEEDSKDKKILEIIDKELEIFVDKILKYFEDVEEFNDDKIEEVKGYNGYLFSYLKAKVEKGEKIRDKEFKIIQLLSMTEVDFSSLSLEHRLTKKNSADQLKKIQLLNNDLKILKKNFSISDKDKNIADIIFKIEKEKKSILKEIGIEGTNKLKFESYQEINKELKSNELLLVFLEDVSIYGTETVSTLLRIVLKRDSVEIEDLSNEYDKVKAYIKKISDSVNLESWPPKDFATLESQKLFSILFKDIDLKNIEENNILIKTNGVISTLPFNILVKDYDKDPQNYETVSWLVDDNNIINIASFKYFFNNKEKESIPKTFLGIGNPTFKKQEEEINVAEINEENILSDIIMSRAAKQRNLVLDALPETEDEVRKISTFFPNTNNKLLLSKKASESVIKKINLEKYSYIVFATHAIPVSETGNIETSGLALTYPKENTNLDNGFLNSQEIMNINLNSELVLLSACETATDDKDIGRAFSGLVNSFFFAGTNSVIASHWKIESNSTVQITTELFQNLTENKMKTSESLRKSILKFKKNNKEFNHPAFWGAFSVTLNARQV